VSVVRTIILGVATAAMRTMQLWARENECQIGAMVWMCWTDASHSDNGRQGAVAVYKHRTQWRSHCSYLRSGHMEVYDAELWGLGLTLDKPSEKRETLQKRRVKMVAILRHTQTAIGQAAQLEPGLGPRLARRTNRRERALLAHGIGAEIHCVPGHGGIP
jgi:hypothetical protein